MEYILKINMDKLKTEYKELPSEYKILGGRGLVARLAYDEIYFRADPLSYKNKLIITNGIFSGTNLPCVNMLAVGGISPLTNRLKTGMAASSMAAKMAYTGIRAIIIEGNNNSEDLYVIKIEEKGIIFKKINSLKNTKISDTASILSSLYSKNIGYLTIGPAGEMKLASASIALSDNKGKPYSYIEQTGLGAVMGAKGIKALVVDNMGCNIANIRYRKYFDNAASKFISSILNTSRGKLQKPSLSEEIKMANNIGCLAVDNYKSGSIKNIQKFLNYFYNYPHYDNETYNIKQSCMHNCPLNCSNVFLYSKGKNLVKINYSHLIMLGINCGIRNIDEIIELTFLCNEYGLNHIEIGGVLGLIRNLDLFDIKSNNYHFEIIKEIINETPLGRISGNGVYNTAKNFGLTRIPDIYGESIGPLDPRGLPEIGIAYLSSPINCRIEVGELMLYYHHLIKDKSQIHKITFTNNISNLLAGYETLGFCPYFIPLIMDKLKIIKELIKGKFGLKLNQTIYNLGFEILHWEEFLYNKSEHRLKNELPSFFYEDKLPPKNKFFNYRRKDLKNIL